MNYLFTSKIISAEFNNWSFFVHGCKNKLKLKWSQSICTGFSILLTLNECIFRFNYDKKSEVLFIIERK